MHPRCHTVFWLAGSLVAAAVAPAGASAVRGVAAITAAQPRTIDLAAADATLTVISGAPDKEQLGNALAFGDLNDDGRSDLVLGAHWGSTGGRNIVGRAYAMFGRDTWQPNYDLAQQITGLWSFMGVGREARMGVSVAAGDVSGDGRDDLIIGSLLADPFDQANAGAVYAMFGGTSAGGRVDFLNSAPDLMIAGNSTALGSDQLGTDVVVGDFNGDGRGDIAAAAVLRTDFEGAVFIWFGPFSKGRIINMRGVRPDRSILGAVPRGFFGTALLADDIDADGRTDLIVAAWSPPPDLEGPTDGGAVHIFRGQTISSATADLSATDADIDIVGPAKATIGGSLSLGQCSCHGQPIVLADLDGDGVRDLAIGAALDDGRRGRIYVLPGPVRGPRIDLAGAPHLTLTSTLPEGKLGWSLASGELDGDGQADLVVALPSAAVSIDGGSRGEGGMILGLRGPLPMTGTLDVNAAAALRVLGADVNAGGTGITLGLADTDGDGEDDLHAGFSNAPGMGRRSVGEAYIVHGPVLTPPPRPTPVPSPTAPPATPTATPQPTSDVTATPTTTESALTPTAAASPTVSPTATPSPPTDVPGGSRTPTDPATADAQATQRLDQRIALPFALLYRPRRRP